MNQTIDQLNVLIVDDERGIREIIREYLELEGCVVFEASDGKQAVDVFESQTIDFMILDVMLPKMDGWQVLKSVRKSKPVPVIMLTARGEEYDKLFGFELGVDDYMVKPFSPKELIARMKAVLSRSQKQVIAENKKQLGDLSIHFDSRRVSLGQESLNLTPKEYDLLSFLIQHPNKVFTRDQLLDLVWGYEFVGDARTVDTHVKMLRENLKQYRRWIVTVWGVGYKFEAEELE